MANEVVQIVKWCRRQSPFACCQGEFELPSSLYLLKLTKPLCWTEAHVSARTISLCTCCRRVSMSCEHPHTEPVCHSTRLLKHMPMVSTPLIITPASQPPHDFRMLLAHTRSGKNSPGSSSSTQISGKSTRRPLLLDKLLGPLLRHRD